MYRCLFLLILVLYSCSDFPRFDKRPLETKIQSKDTIYIVTEVVEHKTLYDTVYVTVEQPSLKSEHQVFIDTLKSYLGVREVTPNSSPEIDRFLTVCNMKEVAYCAGAVAYCLKVNGHDIPPNNTSCWSPAFFPKDRVIWRRGDEALLYAGSVFGLYFKSKGRVAHTGVILEDFGDGWVLTWEANTNQAGSREGDGVYTRLRHKSQIYVVSDWIKKPPPIDSAGGKQTL